MLIETNDQDFEKEVLNSDLPVLVDFWAPWCMPCKMMGGIIEKIAARLGSAIKAVKLNIDENPQMADKYSISSIPTIIIFKKGVIKNTFVGIQKEETLLKAIVDIGKVK